MKPVPAETDRVHTELPESPATSVLWPLALRAADDGHYTRVSELFAAARASGLSFSEAVRWQQLLTEAGDFIAAAEAGSMAGAAPKTGLHLDPLPSPETATGEEAHEVDLLDFEPGARESETPAVAEAIVSSFLRWFAGRGDVYARQWYDARRDRSGYWPVREPLTARVIEQHLLGRITAGQYVLHPDHTVSFAALDFDPTPEAMEQARLANDGEGALGFGPLRDYVRRVVQTAHALGLPAAAEDTGGAGLHLWLFFAPRLPAERARALLRELLWRAGPQPPAVAVELFPKQDRLGGKGLGNLIKLPLGVHQVTLRPSRFLDPQMQPVAEAEGLASLQACDPALIDTLLASRIVALPVAHPGDTGASEASPPPLRTPSGPTPRALAEALAAIPPGRDAERAADRILAGCATVRELARQAHEDGRLSADAARALLYTVGLVGRQNERIEAMFAHAGVSRKELERVRRGLQGPIGCRKLRTLFATLCSDCACPTAPPGGYATPALFALQAAPRLIRAPLPWPEIPVAACDADTESIEQRLGRIESALQELLSKSTDT